MFQKDDILYRQVNNVFKEDFDHFVSSGCYDHLVENELLIPHEELSHNLLHSDTWYKTLLPKKIPFISYPYEWCFNMLKDAALLTLQLVRESLSFGVILKDATPYNIQWSNGKLVFIDTLSFQKYDPAQPWIAYRQFCETFLGPLLLMHYAGQPLQSFLLAFPDGIPLSITKSLLPWRSRLSLHTYLHIHLHEKMARQSVGHEQSSQNNFSEKKLRRLIDSLESLINSLRFAERASVWSNYYAEANQRNDYLQQKKSIIAGWISELPGLKRGLDVGANTGQFSCLLAKNNIDVVACDFDHNPINKLYNDVIAAQEKNILPLVLDVASPTPSIGVNNLERASFIDRTKADICLALALIHHLAIGKNIHFEKMVELFSKITRYLIIEYVPKADEKVQLMLKQKKDIYDSYSEDNFLKAFQKRFNVVDKKEIGDSRRVLFLMKKID